MKTLAIYGSGGLGREVLDLARTIVDVEKTFNSICLIDDYSPNRIVNGAQVLSFEDLLSKGGDVEVSIAIGEPAARVKIREKVIRAGIPLATLIHPTASVGYGANIGAGVTICFSACVSSNTTISENVYMQPFSLIGHDTIVGRDSVLSPHVQVCGNCKIGRETFLGVGCVVKEKVVIGSNSIVSMCSVVMRNVSDGVVVSGNPARVFGNNADQKVFK
jgi:sugar O-acyltransferase (sialic acid O-acetyltransferase NeuD family)